MQTEHLQILIVDDEDIVHETIGDYLENLGHNVAHASGGADGLAQIRKTEFDIVLVDIRMPRMNGLTMMEHARELCPNTSFVVITGHADMETAIEALRRNAADFLIKPIKLEELDAVLEKSRRLRGLRLQTRHMRATIAGIQRASRVRDCAWEFVGDSQAAVAIREHIAEAVHGQCDTVLITGETGTGKEVIARAIHFAAAGEASPFIPVSCPAIPEGLVGSELFGHTKGAFTGATEDREGAFELADDGTLFLDEVGDLSTAAQASLLRVLETRTFRRVGGKKEITVSVRVIAATNTALDEAVEEGAFRRDLYHRLNMYHIHVPPLRERREDILPLAEYFRRTIAERGRCNCEGFTPAAVQLLSGHDFPGNARELRNVIERACIVCRTRGGCGPLDVPYLNHLAPRTNYASAHTTPSQDSDGERSRLLEALESCKWNRRQAARELGMPYSTLRYKIKALGIGQ